MKRIAPVILGFAALVLSTLTCNLFIRETSLINLRTARDEDGHSPTTVYSPADVFFVVGDLKNANADTVVVAIWRAAAVEGYDTDEVIYEQVIDDFGSNHYTGSIYFKLSNDGDWSQGVYKVDILLNGTLVGSLPFSVR